MVSDSIDSVGRRVKALREVRGLSQSELGRRVNVSPQAIQSLESDSNPDRKTRHLVGIAAALEFDPRYLDTASSLGEFQHMISGNFTLAEELNSGELVDQTITQARRNVSLQLRLNGERITGQEYLRRLSEELSRLTSNQP